MTKPPTKYAGSLPSKADILEFMEQATDKVTRRELARAFSIKGADRIALKRLLREMEDEGTVERDRSKALRITGDLPSVTMVEVEGPDAFGDLLLKPLNWKSETPPPKIHLGAAKGHSKVPALGRGDRALVRLQKNDDKISYSATIIKTLEKTNRRLLGIFHGGPSGGRVVPVDKKERAELLVNAGHEGGAKDGDLVLAELLSLRHDRVMGLKPSRIIEHYGDVSDVRHISLIAIHQYGLPTDFSEEAIAEAEKAKPATLEGREDLRDVSLITIDPSDARDHDDAVFAESDTDPDNPGGWHIIVAIADVAHYVRPGGAIDKDARLRGNSAYFPDRVVPMLPEMLSTDLCSLMPGEDRAIMACHIWIDAKGNKRRHRFSRALMRSAGNLSYEEVQGAIDGNPSSAAKPLLDSVLKPLFAAHDALDKARSARGPLNITSDEKRILLDDQGHVVDIISRTALRAHRVIEDYMIAANVCAAETLEAKHTPCMYRVHEEPAADRVESLQEFLDTLDFRLARAQRVTPRMFNKVLEHFSDTPHSALINQVVLRTQTQACYSPDNKGHFGLSLDRYAHFTSPIRRYADILVHRGLIRALGLGKDGLTDADMARMTELGESLSDMERRAMAAERDSVDRYLAGFLAARVGEQFKGTISGVTRFGLFVSLQPSGGDGLVPMSSMGSDYYVYEEHRHALIGQRHGRIYRLGDIVDVRLVEAQPVSGGLKLELVDERSPAKKGKRTPSRPPLPKGRKGSAGLSGKSKKAKGRRKKK